MNHILFGFKGAGKTFLGQKMAQELQCPFYDLDALICLRYNKTVREIFQNEGPERFREIEKQTLQELSKITKSVIALGGGTVLDPENVKLIQKMGTLYYIRSSFENIQARIIPLGTPAFVTDKSLQQIYDERVLIYETIPAIYIDN